MTCAVGPCTEPRQIGRDYCADHGPTRAAANKTPSGAAQLICPHCGHTGRITSKQVKQKQGVSGAKLTGAFLTAGVSMLGTGLSRKVKVTERFCWNCKTTWHV